jgi:hypothetical protein
MPMSKGKEIERTCEQMAKEGLLEESVDERTGEPQYKWARQNKPGVQPGSIPPGPKKRKAKKQRLTQAELEALEFNKEK